MQRRSFLGAVLASFAAPAIAKSGVLMPVKSIIVPEWPPFARPGGLLVPEEAGEALRDAILGPKVDLFDAAGRLLATIRMREMNVREFDYGQVKAASFNGGHGRIEETGRAERFRLSGAGEFDMEGAVGPGGLALNTTDLYGGDCISMTNFELRHVSDRARRNMESLRKGGGRV